MIILALMYLVDFSANSKTSHELVKVSVPEARKVASGECSKVFLSSGSDISGMYITILLINLFNIQALMWTPLMKFPSSYEKPVERSLIH